MGVEGEAVGVELVGVEGEKGAGGKRRGFRYCSRRRAVWEPTRRMRS